MMNIDQMRAVKAILQYDDTSTGAELVYYFVSELGIPAAEAWQVVHSRREQQTFTIPPQEQQRRPRHSI
jgi:hypothetical protein